jgi:hypothetical protein
VTIVLEEEGISARMKSIATSVGLLPVTISFTFQQTAKFGHSSSTMRCMPTVPRSYVDWSPKTRQILRQRLVGRLVAGLNGCQKSEAKRQDRRRLPLISNFLSSIVLVPYKAQSLPRRQTTLVHHEGQGFRCKKVIISRRTAPRVQLCSRTISMFGDSGKHQ